MSAVELERLIEPFRADYLNHLRASVLKARLDHPDLVTELALRVNGEAWDERLLLTRVDMVWDGEGATQLANAELDPIGGDASFGQPTSESLLVNGAQVSIRAISMA